MKPGAYLCLDDSRQVPGDYRCTPVVILTHVQNSVVELKFMTGHHGMRVELADEHPDFRDDEETGTVVLPTRDGPLTLVYPTPALYDELDQAVPGLPEAKTGEAIQAVLQELCLD